MKYAFNTKWVHLSPYVRAIFVRSLEFFRRVVMEKFLPSLSDDVITQEVEKESEASDLDDPSNETIIFYRLITDTRQGLVNGFAVALYHLSSSSNSASSTDSSS
jgi:hypothetical protein